MWELCLLSCQDCKEFFSTVTQNWKGWGSGVKWIVWNPWTLVKTTSNAAVVDNFLSAGLHLLISSPVASKHLTSNGNHFTFWDSYQFSLIKSLLGASFCFDWWPLLTHSVLSGPELMLYFVLYFWPITLFIYWCFQDIFMCVNLEVMLPHFYILFFSVCLCGRQNNGPQKWSTS